MKLSNKDKNTLREMIITNLVDVPDGERIQLDKGLLEDLLFEVVTVNKKKGIRVKLPIWSGDFLKKIDLSQVDFGNVSWDMFSNNYYHSLYETLTDSPNALNMISSIRNQCYANGFLVNYAGTNARIDLGKSFEAIQFGFISINHASFSKVDLSRQSFNGVKEIAIYNSDFSETGLYIPEKIDFRAKSCNFSDINLNKLVINADEYYQGHMQHLPDCVLRNTGINIFFYKDCERRMPEQKLRDLLHYDWIGCYIDGSLVRDTTNLDRKSSSDIKSEYDEMRNAAFNGVNTAFQKVRERKN